jgi:hypothetical protein
MEENKTTEMTRIPAHNSTLAIGGVSCFYDSEVLNSSFVYLRTLVKKNAFVKPQNVMSNAKKTIIT